MTDLEAAELRRTEAKARLRDTVETLQGRLAPKVVVRDAIQTVSDTGSRAIERGTDTARRHPGKIIAAATLIGAFLARKRIARLIRRRDDAPQPARNRRVRNTPGAARRKESK